VAPPAGTLRVGRYFLSLLAILAVAYGLVFWPGHSRAPKLGLDLEGGTQVIFKAETPNGKAPSKSSMNEARTIMENRVNGYGVANATVVVAGTNEIQISVPGKGSSAIANIGAAAVLNFRALVMAPVPTAAEIAAQNSAAASASASASSTAAATASASAAASAGPAPTSASPTATATTSPAATANASPSATASATPTTTGSATAKPSENPLANLGFAIPQTEDAYAKLTTAQQTQLQTAASNFDCSSKPPDTNAAKTYLACDSTDPKTATMIYLLGPVIVPGTEIGTASAVAPGTQQGQTQWVVSLHLKSTGQSNWASWTAKHNTGGATPSEAITSCGTGTDATTGAATTSCADYVAFTLDSAVVTAPFTQGTINGDTQISGGGNGGFSQKSATDLANQLKYGALPLSFKTESNLTVSATLGSGQLKAGLLAGGIGLILVVVYSLIYYRALGLVTISSLLVSGGLTYAMLVILGREIGFTLTLAGIAGFIVAVGITADSFVVFFERIKDEVHEGRSMRVAVPRAWVRARRTILSADTVSFLAAAILYYFAAGDVKGFAFTLGLSTILDLVVVFLFTHPLVSLLSRSAAFGSARFTGLDSAREGGVVKSVDAPTRISRPRRSRGGVAVLEPEVDEPDIDYLDQQFDDIVDAPVAEDFSAPVERAPAAPTSTPVEGETAAERAAARRARMRGKPLKKAPPKADAPEADSDDDTSTDPDTDGQS
jgi:preprotein translocase subunit SecD